MSHRGKAVMVLGTTSGAGKSWLATALCRWYARQGLRVAPFKAQNMSNNARVVPGLNGGAGEIGSAQYFQALAARRVPEVRMNPVLLKPEADTQSQVVVLGEVDAALSAMPWRERSALLKPRARAALLELLGENDVVVIEGAGSPAEINLAPSDYVNLGTARDAHAACLLVTDIDRGGAFAHLYGTHQLMPDDVRAQVKGFVLNRFRGDAGLLAPGPEQLEQLTGVPTIATLPLWRGHGLPEEDGVFDSAATGEGLHIAVVAYPRLSNLDEFQPLRQLPGVRLSWAREPRDLAGADWIVLPGSKSTAADLAWLRAQRLDLAINAHRGRVLGICGCWARRSSTRMAWTATRRAWACCPSSPSSSRTSCCAARPCASTPPRAPGRRWPACRPRATRSATAARSPTPACRRRGSRCAMRRARPSAGRLGACWASMRTACSSSRPCCRRCSARAAGRWMPSSMAWRISLTCISNRARSRA
jgi:cobyric acid synthase CobQ